jgi:UDP-N-acetylglucosamine 2-epimerase
LKRIIKAIKSLEYLIIFPCHPRTKAKLEKLGLLSELEGKIKLVDPFPYFSMLNLVSEAKFVLTDSGGLQKEAFWLNVPCVTLRDTTEWTETVDAGANVLVGSNSDKISTVVHKILKENDDQRIYYKSMKEKPSIKIIDTLLNTLKEE